VDYYRIANIVLDEFRGAKIGRITLEEPVNTDESAK
jgi:ribosome biogenesis GTPase A